MASALPPDLEAYVKQKLNTGEFSSRDELEAHALAVYRELDHSRWENTTGRQKTLGFRCIPRTSEQMSLDTLLTTRQGHDSRTRRAVSLSVLFRHRLDCGSGPRVNAPSRESPLDKMSPLDGLVGETAPQH